MSDDELKTKSVTYILGGLTQQVRELADRIDKLTDGTYKRITDLETTKADRVAVDRIQKALDDNVEVRLQSVEKIAIARDKQDTVETTITILKVTLTLYGVFMIGLTALIVWHILHSPIS
jgi:hypothetical protein